MLARRASTFFDDFPYRYSVAHSLWTGLLPTSVYFCMLVH